eukprot:gnl/TRDRNA2_/TRDRNA2_188602_c0_seq1.p1 gnl/TRDRNA2_/TRDRNA2_188602_c0~~gnl/TRDRNA2_/TRDRNA2_188602_c0_seq1.p1  ORF type:complete len:410 (+),score=87.24 gnl/TRDRNA2_/TRDRNA2_188602_c0_seq1:44-1273(+)
MISDDAEPNPNLFFTGLPQNVDEEILKTVFGQYGNVVSIKLLDRDPSKPDRAAMIKFADINQAVWIVNHLNGNIPQGFDQAVVVKYSKCGPGTSFGKSMGKGDSTDRFSPYGTILSDKSGLTKTGRVKAWIEEKGMGFITPQDGTEDIFVHRSAISDGGALVPGSVVMYEAGWNTAKNKAIVTSCSGGVPQPGKGSAPSAPMMGGMGGMAMGMGKGGMGMGVGGMGMGMGSMGMGSMGMGMGAGMGMGMGMGAGMGMGLGMPAVGMGAAGGGPGTGTVKAWLEDKGMGFITPSDGSADIFVHRSSLLDAESLMPGTPVTFEMQWDEAKNKPIARSVSTAGGIPTMGMMGGVGMGGMGMAGMGMAGGMGMGMSMPALSTPAMSPGAFGSAGMTPGTDMTALMAMGSPAGM